MPKLCRHYSVFDTGLKRLVDAMQTSLKSVCLLISVFLLLMAGFPSISVGQKADEYALKASFINRFMQFVSWPDQKPAEPFVIGIVGKSPFDGSLDDAFAESRPGDKDIRINYISEVDEAINCNLLFIAGSEKDNLPLILEQVSAKAILTISDTDGFGEAGVIINFYIDDTRLHFEINLKAAKKSGLEFDPNLLNYARILDSSEEPDDEH